MDKKEREKYYKHSQGLDCWHISSAKNENVKITVNDGPCGVRKPIHVDPVIAQDKILPSISTISPSALAASFSKKAAYENGKILASECADKKVDILLAPGINIKRSTICGRNFEYFSEDPFLSGMLAASYINGIQDNGGAACIKHYCCNNKEWARLGNSSEISKRALREIYLRNFEYAITHSNPASLMTSYNRVNGEYVHESDYLINTVLRKEFGYDGLIMSDWSAVSYKGKAIKNGLDVEMPVSPRPYEIIENEFEKGIFTESDLKRNDDHLDKCIGRILSKNKSTIEESNKLRKRCLDIACQTTILIRNENKYLPFTKEKKVLVIGYLANHPHTNGGGSAGLNGLNKKSFIDVLHENNLDFYWVRGYDDCGRESTTIDQLKFLKSKNYEQVIFFAGMLDSDECEGRDRATIDIRKEQIDCFEKVSSVFDKVGVVVETGGVLNIKPFLEKADAVLVQYPAGETQEEGLFKNIFGDCSPSGKLPETWVYSLDSNPIYKELLKNNTTYEYYDDDIYVGYRYYLDKKVDFCIPFGFGLSYLDVIYNGLKVSCDSKTIELSFDVTNLSTRDGDEVIQIYVGKKNSNVYRPIYELKCFDKISLKSKETKHVVENIKITDLSIYDLGTERMVVEDGNYEIYVCKDSKTILMESTIYIPGKELKESKKPAKLERKSYDKEFSINTPLSKFQLLGEGIAFNYLKSLCKCDEAKLYETIHSDSGMLVRGLYESGIVPADAVYKLVEYCNKFENIEDILMIESN